MGDGHLRFCGNDEPFTPVSTHSRFIYYSPHDIPAFVGAIIFLSRLSSSGSHVPRFQISLARRLHLDTLLPKQNLHLLEMASLAQSMAGHVEACWLHSATRARSPRRFDKVCRSGSTTTAAFNQRSQATAVRDAVCLGSTFR